MLLTIARPDRKAFVPTLSDTVAQDDDQFVKMNYVKYAKPMCFDISNIQAWVV